MAVIRALEFYCGIGGLHLAFLRSHLRQPKQVVTAYDWDQTATKVYSHNFKDSTCNRVDLSKLEIEAVPDADLWLLSPSCQPYTTLNPNARGADDPRAASFLHLIRGVIPSIQKRPSYILVENVGGFETSTTRDTLCNTLRGLGYYTTELLLSPSQFGIPNSRKRYYFLARMTPFVSDMVLPVSEPQPISHYLSQNVGEEYSVPARVLEKWGRLFDIVRPSHTRSCCFTRGYTQLVERAGSILQLNEDLDTTDVFDRFLEAQAAGDAEAVSILRPLRLRYFTPEELLRLFAFVHPGSDSYSFPQDVSRKSRFRLIGNSVNVCVVTALIEYLFMDDTI